MPSEGGGIMAYVIAEPCIGVKDRAMVNLIEEIKADHSLLLRRLEYDRYVH